MMKATRHSGGCSKNSTVFAKRLTSLLCLPAWLGLAVTAATAQSDQAEPSRDRDESRSWPVDITLAAGLQYDDLVTVDELDQSIDESDTAAVVDLDIEYEKRFSQGTDLDLGYSLSQKSYFDQSAFDLQIHNVSLGLKQNFDDFDIGIRSYAVHARLDDEGLLDFQHVSPYFTTFLTERVYLRAGYYYRNKTFPDNPGRDGHVHAGHADFYFFADGTMNYFVAGYTFEREDTTAGEFGFDGQQLAVRWSRRFHWYGERPVRLRLDWRLEQRDYAAITPSIGVRRDDERQRWRARFDFPITRTLTGLLSYQHRSHDSNLPAADYDDNRVEAQLEVVF